MTRITCERRGPNAELVINFLFFLTTTLLSAIKIITFRFLLLSADTNCSYVKKSLTIPVNIRVTDANDNSPIFRNSTYFINISEVIQLEFSNFLQ